MITMRSGQGVQEDKELGEKYMLFFFLLQGEVRGEDFRCLILAFLAKFGYFCLVQEVRKTQKLEAFRVKVYLGLPKKKILITDEYLLRKQTTIQQIVCDVVDFWRHGKILVLPLPESGRITLPKNLEDDVAVFKLGENIYILPFSLFLSLTLLNSPETHRRVRALYGGTHRLAVPRYRNISIRRIYQLGRR